MSRLLKIISPEVSLTVPAIVSSSEVLPEPLAPMMATISPGFICSEMPFSTLSFPYPDSRLRILSIVLSQVHGYDLAVPLDLRGCALGDFFAVGKNGYLVGNVHDEGHVVLDQEYGDARGL